MSDSPLPSWIPHSRPVFDAPYALAVQAVVDSGMLAHGDEVALLQQDIGQALGCAQVLAVDSGTSALMLSIRALLQHKQGARVGIPAYACAALLFAVKAAGATPVAMDCNADLTLNQAKATPLLDTLDVLVLVHPFGMVEPWVEATFPCPVIEDIAQSVGATWRGQQVGTFADISIGSLYATKPWGGAYGGFICCQDKQLLQQIQSMTDPDQADMGQPYAGHHQLSNVHACLARQRIRVAPTAWQERRETAQKYDKIIKNSMFSPILTQKHAVSNHFRYIVRSPAPAKDVIAQLRGLGIAASHPVKAPLHHALPDSFCPQADLAWQHDISLPMLADMCAPEWKKISQGLQSCSLS